MNGLGEEEVFLLYRVSTLSEMHGVLGHSGSKCVFMLLLWYEIQNVT